MGNSDSRVFDPKAQARVTTISSVLSTPEARIAILGDGGLVRVEASLPKLLCGNNVSTVCDPLPAVERLREFVLDHVTGDVRSIDEMDCLRVDFCHNFRVGAALHLTAEIRAQAYVISDFHKSRPDSGPWAQQSAHILRKPGISSGKRPPGPDLSSTCAEQ